MPWDAIPVNRGDTANTGGTPDSGLYEFFRPPSGVVQPTSASNGIVSVRVYFEFRRGAYSITAPAVTAWKTTPLLMRLALQGLATSRTIVQVEEP